MTKTTRVYEATDGTTFRGDNRKVWLVLADSFMEAGAKAEANIRERNQSHSPYENSRELRSIVLLGETNV